MMSYVVFDDVVFVVEMLRGNPLHKDMFLRFDMSPFEIRLIRNRRSTWRVSKSLCELWVRTVSVRFVVD